MCPVAPSPCLSCVRHACPAGSSSRRMGWNLGAQSPAPCATTPLPLFGPPARVAPGCWSVSHPFTPWPLPPLACGPSRPLAPAAIVLLAGPLLSRPPTPRPHLCLWQSSSRARALPPSRAPPGKQRLRAHRHCGVQIGQTGTSERCKLLLPPLLPLPVLPASAALLPPLPPLLPAPDFH